MYGSTLLVLLPAALAAAGYSVLGLLRGSLVVLAIEGAILGLVELSKPETVVTFSRGFNETRPAYRRLWLIPVNRSSARSMGIGHLLIALVCALVAWQS